jgi:hypothetical protein
MVIVQVGLRSREEEKWPAASSNTFVFGRTRESSLAWGRPGSSGQTQSQSHYTANDASSDLVTMNLELAESESEYDSMHQRTGGMDGAHKERLTVK